jgi:hypothetical protein
MISPEDGRRSGGAAREILAARGCAVLISLMKDTWC